MLNKQLFEDPKDVEIVRLKLLIERFKKYDKERQDYYAKKMQRLGELESLLDEIKDSDANSWERQALKLKGEIRRLQTVIQVRGIEETRSDEELKEIIRADELKTQLKRLNLIIQARGIEAEEEKRTDEELREIISAKELRKQNRELRKRIKSLQKSVDSLSLDLLRLRRKIAENDNPENDNL